MGACGPMGLQRREEFLHGSLVSPLLPPSSLHVLREPNFAPLGIEIGSLRLDSSKALLIPRASLGLHNSVGRLGFHFTYIDIVIFIDLY